MLFNSIFTYKPAPVSVWLSAGEPVPQETKLPNAIARAHSRRLRRMQAQNFIQRAAYEVVHLFKKDSEVA